MRTAGQNGIAATIFKDSVTVQDLRYTYDPVGNIIRIEDAALKTVFHANHRVESASDYTYDPLYRLIEARGREHIGQSAFAFAPPHGNDRDYPFVGAAQLHDLQALRNYTEQYDYDPVGNFQRMFHRARHGNWTRAYSYDHSSLIEPANKSNRLSQTALLASDDPPAEKYSYDAQGNITRMPHLPLMQWDFRDKLSATSRHVVNAGAPETTYYVYDGSGQRARKITERQNGAPKNERFYLGGFEIYREFDAGGAIALERETLHVMDDKRRIALVETQTIDTGLAVAFPAPVQRYQLANHLGSASLELDGGGGLISYEEYSPYGSTTYQVGQSAAEVSLKRYRYTGKERDEENGFTYHGARYYAPWLGRWLSCDPAEMIVGPNLFSYCGNNPVAHVDPAGTDPQDVSSPKPLVVSHEPDNIVGDNVAYKATYQPPQTLTLRGATDTQWKQGDVKLLGAGLSLDNSLLSAGSRSLSRLVPGIATTAELHFDWSPEPLLVDIQLRGRLDLSPDVLNTWRRGQPIDAKFKAVGSATADLDFNGIIAMGTLRVATPLEIEADARATSHGERLNVSYQYGHWYSHSEESRTYESSGWSLTDLGNFHKTAETTTNYGIGFYEKPAVPEGLGNPRPLSPSRQYSTGSSTQADPVPPDPEGRLTEHHRIGTTKYFGPGYSYSRTRFGESSFLPKSRLDITFAGGVTFSEQSLPNGGGGIVTLKYAWW